MKLKVIKLGTGEEPQWDHYVQKHPLSTLYHLSNWREIIKETYKHKDYYLMAVGESGINCDSNEGAHIKGILPLIHIKHLLFGNSLISVPFCDYGGILADNSDAKNALIKQALCLSENIKSDEIEMRNIDVNQVSDIENLNNVQVDEIGASSKWNYTVRSHKVRMIFELPDTGEKLMNSFKSKLRSQIRKPMREGLYAKTGGNELLNDFYNVFSYNMKELGSPVHSKKIIEKVITKFGDDSRIVVVYDGEKPLAGSVIIGFRNTLENPWASALREYSAMSPNMLLYFTMLEYGCENGYKKFDFGRSSPGEGTYKFKKQWGAKAETLNWQYITKNPKNPGDNISENTKYKIASQMWKKLPVPLSRLIGPRIRKYIGL